MQNVLKRISPVRLAIALLLIGIVICLGIVICAANSAIQAEHTLHANLLVLDIVSQHCKETGVWPKSWNELLEIQPTTTYAQWNWPEDQESIRERIAIDFSLSIEDVENMDPERFTAIEPLPPSFPLHEDHLRAFAADLRSENPK